ncbi:uncharacterized protein FFUJ_10036 [Fusarium fujikuroi IMI 58289]|uniref:Metallo-beta-lactamase domain-containing protein n=1 Tax=Gibberella fujikuroi (strain CBS 195.34 / IMI 58289 / NRRL A-6831) TaxID=1279085 RepID=S0EE95_GIBF5|nr:uncharacterized protein FFUJ_10036 [Fusarium fujikuroi IMI 58289]CCT73281.1 uncharacterized protein FFUJ_10036 [Fusarium fujikuroi IMI 58289]SCO16515.1 uncharacterized protein FFM5_11293 [Fusarium fujikuroi]
MSLILSAWWQPIIVWEHQPVGTIDWVCNEAKKAMLPYEEKGLMKVVTYQLPVPCGDCSVHLLIDGDGQTLSAFIMDGGRDAQGLKACDVVLSGLKIITRIHNLKPHFLRVWVVTHWDKDHYEGVLELLQYEKLHQELNEYIQTDNFMLYGVTSKKARSKIIATIKLGLGVIGCNFFGEEFNKSGVGFWCVGGDGYSYDTAIDFKSLPTPQSDKNTPKKPQLVCKNSTYPTQNERSLMAATIWPNADQAKLLGVLFLIGCIYNEGNSKHDGKLLYTTRLPYWVDASKFEEWCNTDINLSGRISGLFRSGGPLSKETKFLSGNESKNALVKMFEDSQSRKNAFWRDQLKKPLQEEDDEDEEDDPPYTHQAALKDFLLNKHYNDNAGPDDSIQARVTRELEASIKEGTDWKYKMDDENEMDREAQIDTEQKADKDKMDEEVKKETVRKAGKDKEADKEKNKKKKKKKKKKKGENDRNTDDKQNVVQECVNIWNTISEQSIK